MRKATKLDEGKVYRIEFKERITMDIYQKEEPNIIYDQLVGGEGDTEIVSILEVDEEKGATLIFENYDKVFTKNIPLSAFELRALKVIVWEMV